MFVQDVINNKRLQAVVERLTEIDFITIENSRRFNNFSWNLYKEHEVYKLRLKGRKTILGLICIIDHPGKAINAIEIELIEVGKENIGLGKKIDGIAGCLIAFACKESFKRRHEGVVFLTPKTCLVNHYTSAYGFTYLPIKTFRSLTGFMVLNKIGSFRIIARYMI
ncbi:hypothetical protein [Filimonas effusa]|uniref:N-acetyltransferase domain-containing protein n=1 Tax=Filimonas effusa TaxID=2508721 RepID=A0A4Q1CZZ5_9BACT|nr:hypothetical protein [Filimonas effusa]RXK81000.1 hypothetical protein ESB13_22875 [Filimonas effusa]